MKDVRRDAKEAVGSRTLEGIGSVEDRTASPAACVEALETTNGNLRNCESQVIFGERVNDRVFANVDDDNPVRRRRGAAGRLR